MPTNGNHTGQVIAATNDAVEIKRLKRGLTKITKTVPMKPLKT